MQLVEQHIIKKSDSRWKAIDDAAFVSKNLYNAANYVIRQEFIHNGRYILFKELYHLVKGSDEYKALPAKVSNLVLKTLSKNWKSYSAAIKEWRENSEKFTGKPSLPKYKPKQKGRNLLIYDIQAISKVKLRQNIIKPSKLDIEVPTQQQNIDQVRIIPKKTHYVVEVVYERQPSPADVDPDLIAGIDIGLNNLAAVASNKPGFIPLLVNGRPLKSINQFYNKHKAHLVSQLPDPEKGTSERIERLTDKRNRKIKHELHMASRYIIDYLLKERIGTLVIGKNPNWKQEINIGKKNNQNFVSIPHGRFVEMLSYKAELRGINVYKTQECYTSKCSFLDLEPIYKHKTYMGQRVKRGLFCSKSGYLINADLNGAYNILRKVAPNAFADGVEGFAVTPLKISRKLIIKN